MSDTIDPSQVQWDDESPTAAADSSSIDASQVQWDDDTPAKAPARDFASPSTSAPTVGHGFWGGVGNAIQGVGKGLTDDARGVYQAGAELGHKAGLVSDDKLNEIQQNIDASKRQDAPLENTTAGKVGDAIGAAAPMLAVPGAGIAGSAAVGAGLGALQPVASDESRGLNTGAGAIGGAAGAGLGRLVSGVIGGAGGANAARRGAVDILKDEGVPLSVGQTTGSKLATHVERASAITSDAPAEFANTQAQAFNRAVLRRVGVNDPNVTAAGQEILGPAKSKITGVMDDVADRSPVKYDPQLESELAEIEQRIPSEITESDAGPVRTSLSNIVSGAAANDGVIPGTLYQKINSSLGALSKRPATAPLVEDIQEALHGALQRSAAPEDQAALAQARVQYRALKTIEPAVDRATGNISPLRLMSELSSKRNANLTLYGKGDQSLFDLARAGKQVIPDTLGNSGTAERSLPALSAIETLGSGEPVKAGIKLAAGKFGLDMAGKGLRSQGIVGNYLKSGIPVINKAAPAIKGLSPAAGYGAGETVARASGGKVGKSIDELVEHLIHRWKSAKKQTDATTKPLLKVPDATIVKALDIAGRAI